MSLDSKNGSGEAPPSGNGLRKRVCEVGFVDAVASLKRAVSALTEEQQEAEFTRRFSGCKAGSLLHPLPTFLCKRIFTPNNDDAVDDVCTRPGNHWRSESHQFRDTYSESRNLDGMPVIHLHGRTKDAGRGYVFDRAAYAFLMADDNAWMTVLAGVTPAEPFFVIGTSLDEVDMAFYLARLTGETQRSERGPPFLIESFPTKLTRQDRDRHGFASTNALGPVVPAAAGLAAKRAWSTKFEMRSPRWATCLAEAPIIRAA